MMETYEDFITRTGLRAGALPASGRTLDTTPLEQALPPAVQQMRTFMQNALKARDATIQTQLSQTLSDLKRLQDRQLEQLELDLGKRPEGLRQNHRARRTIEIGKVFDEYRQWVEDTLTLEPTPYIRVLAAFCH
jgi:hypothetical protein